MTPVNATTRARAWDTPTTPTTPFAQQATNHRLPAWCRMWIWALANANAHGHAPAYQGQLRQVLDCDAPDVSRAIRMARERKLIDYCSNASCIVLPGHRNAPCHAIHRGDV